MKHYIIPTVIGFLLYFTVPAVKDNFGLYGTLILIGYFILVVLIKDWDIIFDPKKRKS